MIQIWGYLMSERNNQRILEEKRIRARKKMTRKIRILCISTFVLGFISAWFICSKVLAAEEENSLVAKVIEDDITVENPETKEEVVKEPNQIGETNFDSSLTTMLVNWEHPMEAGYEPKLAEIENNYMVDERIVEDLSRMLADARAEGLDPWICSAYRSVDRQQELYDNKFAYYRNMGYGEKRAEELAATVVARPGTSEHATGLAVDIVSRGYQILDKKQERTAETVWLMENCYKYGFILRYPNQLTDLMGIIYEPWHYRYVGVEAATQIMDEGICLEEYLKNIDFT